MKDYYQFYKKERPWMLVFQRVKARCNNTNVPNYKWYGGKGIKCLITEEQIKELWFRDKAHEMKQPSIDRIDSTDHYRLDNCRFLEHAENSIKDQRYNVIQLSKDNKFIKEWISLREVERKLGIAHASVSDVLRGKRKTAGGFKWKRR